MNLQPNFPYVIYVYLYICVYSLIYTKSYGLHTTINGLYFVFALFFYSISYFYAVSSLENSFRYDSKREKEQWKEQNQNNPDGLNFKTYGRYKCIWFVYLIWKFRTHAQTLGSYHSFFTSFKMFNVGKQQKLFEYEGEKN